ncbi:hypothetical protein HK105_207631 [Polyrhizophydium stewartii]|uniref:Uncharacterized protein n=1 Tax=Polyrhizophydium stewartii TaxID=2732419 RepID=A0ABR4N026_9FUNG
MFHQVALRVEAIVEEDEDPDADAPAAIESASSRASTLAGDADSTGAAAPGALGPGPDGARGADSASATSSSPDCDDDDMLLCDDITEDGQTPPSDVVPSPLAMLALRKLRDVRAPPDSPAPSTSPTTPTDRPRLDLPLLADEALVAKAASDFIDRSIRLNDFHLPEFLLLGPASSAPSVQDLHGLARPKSLDQGLRYSRSAADVRPSAEYGSLHHAYSFDFSLRDAARRRRAAAAAAADSDGASSKRSSRGVLAQVTSWATSTLRLRRRRRGSASHDILAQTPDQHLRLDSNSVPRHKKTGLWGFSVQGQEIPKGKKGKIWRRLSRVFKTAS